MKEICLTLNLLLLDKQFLNMGFTVVEISEIVQKGINGGVQMILEQIAQSYCEKQEIEYDFDYILIKNGGLLLLTSLIKASFRDFKFIHIIRDPRAVVNSNINNIRPYYKNEKMGRGDPVFISRLWVKYSNHSRRMAAIDENMIEIKYEDVLVKWYDIKVSLERFLGVLSSIKNSSKYVYKIAHEENNIHRNVGKPAIKARANAWRNELSHRMLVIIEYICTKEMIARGYKLLNDDIDTNKYDILYSYVMHYLKTLYHYWIRSTVYFKNPRLFYNNIRLRVYRKGD